MSSKAGPSTTQPATAALQTATTNFKRLSTIKSNNSSPGKKPAQSLGSSLVGKDVVSPAELCGFVSFRHAVKCGREADDRIKVDNLLGQLETRFEDMSDQILYVHQLPVLVIG